MKEDHIKNKVEMTPLEKENEQELLLAEAVMNAASIDLDVAWKKQRSMMLEGESHQAHWWGYAWKVAAMILLVASAFLLYPSGPTVLTTQSMPIETILPEGSTIILNSGSKLEYKKGFGQTHRITSFSGEAYFQITRDEANPFIIDLGTTNIKVLGTKFLVNTNDAGLTTVSVTEGTVLFYDNEGKFTKKLTANQSAVWDSERLQLSNTYSPNIISWYTKHFIFDGTRLDEVLDVIGKAYQVEFQYDDQDLIQCQLTSEFKGEDLSIIMETIETIYPLTFEAVSNNTWRISGTPCE